MLSTFTTDADANVYAAVTQQCRGSMTAILALQTEKNPGAKAWRLMMDRSEITEVHFKQSIENRFKKM